MLHFYFLLAHILSVIAFSQDCSWYTLAKVAGTPDEIRRIGENGPLFREYIAFKRSANPEPRTVDLSDGCMSLACPLLSQEPKWVSPELRGLPTLYEKAVLELRKGDTVIFDGKSYRLGEFLGAGNATHIFALADRPNEAIRIPLLTPDLAKLPHDEVNTEKAQTERLNRIRGYIGHYVKMEKAKQGVAPIIGEPDPQNRFLIVKAVDGMVTGKRVLDALMPTHKTYGTEEVYILPDDLLPEESRSAGSYRLLMKLVELLKKNGEAKEIDGKIHIQGRVLRQYLLENGDAENWYYVDPE